MPNLVFFPQDPPILKTPLPMTAAQRMDEETVQELFDDWAVSLPSLDRKFLAVGLMHSFQKRQQMSVMDAAREAASFCGVNERTVRQYRKEFFDTKGKFKKSQQGKYKRFRLLNDENLHLEAAMFVTENSYKKGSANLTAQMFCEITSSCRRMICQQTYPG